VCPKTWTSSLHNSLGFLEMVIQCQIHSLSAFLLFEFFVLCCNPKAALEKRGVGALELVAMDMKARGMYVCRTLSFKGAEFSIGEVPLESKMQGMYYKACYFWSALRTELMCALDALQEKKPSQNQLWRLYWANHQVLQHCPFVQSVSSLL
jgi:hypothetical protein